MTRAAGIARKPRQLPKVLQQLSGGAESLPEVLLLNRLRLLHFPEPQTQVMLIPHRRYRFDVVWPDPYRVAVEVQGGVHRAAGGKPCQMCGEVPSGRHTRGTGYESDATKSALAQIEGYIVLYVTPGMIQSGVAGMLIGESLKSRGWRRMYSA